MRFARCDQYGHDRPITRTSAQGHNWVVIISINLILHLYARGLSLSDGPECIYRNGRIHVSRSKDLIFVYVKALVKILNT